MPPEISDTRARLRSVLTDGKRYIVETKGQEDVNVAKQGFAPPPICAKTHRAHKRELVVSQSEAEQYAKLQADTFAT